MGVVYLNNLEIRSFFRNFVKELKFQEVNGTPKRIRTSDRRYRKPVLYPAELWTHTFFVG